MKENIGELDEREIKARRRFWNKKGSLASLLERLSKGIQWRCKS